jgi:hypothetical protein
MSFLTSQHPNTSRGASKPLKHSYLNTMQSAEEAGDHDFLLTLSEDQSIMTS